MEAHLKPESSAHRKTVIVIISKCDAHMSSFSAREPKALLDLKFLVK